MNHRKIIDRILEVLLIVILSILVLDVVWQVASRYLLANPSKFTDELAGFLLMWVSLFGAAWVTGKNQHMAINLLERKLKGQSRKIIRLIINLIVILFAVFVFLVGGTWFVYTRFHLGQISPALELPLGYVYLVLPLSGLFILYYSIDNTINEMTSKIR
ncbi:MAG: TRAP transporter small permease [Bacteroidetes bacterium]|nr:MAG: TRAP transporter small permease [Bacteroidota bacterium]